MRILLTNDDGIHARGIHTLVRELSSIAELYVVAPDRERSGTGHSITVFDPIRVIETNIADTDGAWIVGGTPVDCVKLGLSRLVNNVDYVVSGINHGPNLGTDVLYSGTVSAAAEGVIMGVPSIAVSLDSYDENMEFDYAAKFTRNVLRVAMKRGIEDKTLININIPPLDEKEIKGLRITKLGVRNYDNLFEERQDPRGNTYYWLGGGVIKEEQEVDSDVVATQDGYISVTPIHLDLTDYQLIQEYRKSFSVYLNFGVSK
ncbi:MAG TPA: 5'/3'-nucleotidase SurE [Gelria sp.]|nr:5'/3'-nucleotidase SurE [Gelria sp.]